MGRVEGKVALVTGAASGMGRADAILLAAEGARVVVADMNETDGRAVADAIGERAVFMRLNVTDEDVRDALDGECQALTPPHLPGQLDQQMAFALIPEGFF